MRGCVFILRGYSQIVLRQSPGFAKKTALCSEIAAYYRVFSLRIQGSSRSRC